MVVYPVFVVVVGEAPVSRMSTQGAGAIFSQTASAVPCGGNLTVTDLPALTATLSVSGQDFPFSME